MRRPQVAELDFFLPSPLVCHLHKKESLRRRREARPSAILRCQDLRHFFPGTFSPTAIDQRTDDGSDHVPQEAVGFHRNSDHAGRIPFHGNGEEGPDAVGAVGVGGAEGGKIVRPLEYGECVLYPRQIEGLPDEPGVVSFQDRTDRPVADPVEIHFAHRIEAGMK